LFFGKGLVSMNLGFLFSWTGIFGLSIMIPIC
jgi:hypothetical protein